MCEPCGRVDDNEDKARVDTTVSITVLVNPLMHQPIGLCKMDAQKLICEWRQCCLRACLATSISNWYP